MERNQDACYCCSGQPGTRTGGTIVSPKEGRSVWYLALKAIISGLLVAAVSEFSKRYPGIAGLLAALPLVAVLSLLWAWREKVEPEKIAALSASTFWFVLPSLPMFLLIPQLLHRDWGIGFALLCGCLLTMALYLLLVWVGPWLGINL